MDVPHRIKAGFDQMKMSFDQSRFRFAMLSVWGWADTAVRPYAEDLDFVNQYINKLRSTYQRAARWNVECKGREGKVEPHNSGGANEHRRLRHACEASTAQAS